MNAKYTERNIALKLLRIGRKLAGYDAVIEADEELVQAIAAKRSEPPNPLPNFTYRKIAYRLQSWKEGTAIYVRADQWCEELYVYEPVSKYDLVRREISIAAEIQAELSWLESVLPPERFECGGNLHS